MLTIDNPRNEFVWMRKGIDSKLAIKYTYILLTKREGRTGRTSAQGLDSTDRAKRGPYKKDRGPIFS